MYALILCGRRSIELQKWGNLSVSVKLFQNVFSAFSNSYSSASVTPRDVRKGKNFTVSYLVESLGLASKIAESISRKVSFEDKANPDSVLNLFKSYGFTESQIGDIITDYPLLLIEDAEKSLAPKLQSLQSRGASSSELTEIVSKVPKMLGMKEDKTISVYYDFVREIIKADKSSKFETLCHSSLPQGSAIENKIRNVLVLRELGVPQKLLFSMLISNFRTVCGKAKFEDTIKKVVGMGFDPTSLRFVQALNVVYQMSDETMQEKVSVYKGLGFDVGEVWEMFRKYPPCIGFSEKKILSSVETYLELGFTRDEVTMMVKRFPSCIGLSAETVKRKTEFLVKQMDWSLKDVASHPQVFSYSMEKRIVPRCNVIKALMSKGLLGSKLPSMSPVLSRTDQTFLNKYVLKHDKELVPELMAVFTRVRHGF
ncbi:unnamed protein product [Microthlaspi erraticum]|uniref:Uncharacterized protein n=1 Tax=Microthlaspi erraticum TaxID=1685480 RepID=A0A6D2ILB2_9BRAS|nr:unnamed protein product [Microthlaspi erraticum]